ncbi:nuclear transport factor 2 family protein [Mycobacteroides abscessus]|uniref:nuclear transport factor 2 family protein n=1 Tax=Mycobacteroides abscessus TaxID=36809 RepID=UPI0009266FA0|nr:nuclear transport factor 2 family protein [Mycobacteroides abscessus]SHO98055.1 SnoaL-like domain [Mycobacteroides abscessus subsp. abscessus]SHS29957.1 SnoaL-like domain [Mycobacteroides abscessus subsp. abscessus]SHS69910.1 SnoaL-like domain [Mycobacteroides abscessus subsp. abscessus]SKD78645.1 SnoaL-like domain [Mycobacteroides abscessus subsp. abscessus]SKG08732.1 SnoaL-like domain [Mycobacteroides abscessus subsp. abscessus]
MAKLGKFDPSPEHALCRALLPEFWRKVEQQEAEAIARGLPAEGMTAFMRTWFDGWGTQDIEKIKSCVAEDATYIDSSSFQVRLGGPGLTAEHCRIVFDMMPDIGFYPQDGSNRSLPYADYFEGCWRLTIPWRGVGRFTGKVELPHFPGVTIPPNGRCLNFIGIDRYTLTSDFKITHIDTDWDMMFAALQMIPFGTSLADAALRIASRPVVFRAIGAVLRLSMPFARFLNIFSATPSRIRESTVQKVFAPEGLVFPYEEKTPLPVPSVASNKSRHRSSAISG